MKASEIKRNRVYHGHDGEKRYVLHRGRDSVQYSPMIGDRVLCSAEIVPLDDFAQWAWRYVECGTIVPPSPRQEN